MYAYKNKAQTTVWPVYLLSFHLSESYSLSFIHGINRVFSKAIICIPYSQDYFVDVMHGKPGHGKNVLNGEHLENAHDYKVIKSWNRLPFKSIFLI